MICHPTVFVQKPSKMKRAMAVVSACALIYGCMLASCTLLDDTRVAGAEVRCLLIAGTFRWPAPGALMMAAVCCQGPISRKMHELALPLPSIR